MRERILSGGETSSLHVLEMSSREKENTREEQKKNKDIQNYRNNQLR